jgi:hypothetical protein
MKQGNSVLTYRDIITKDINIIEKYELKIKPPKKKKSDNPFIMRDFLKYERHTDGNELPLPNSTELRKALNMNL